MLKGIFQEQQMKASPFYNSLPMFCWVIILFGIIGPFKLKYRVLFITILSLILKHQLLVIIGLSISCLCIVLTKNNKLFRFVAHSMIYDYLKCDTVIPLPIQHTLFVIHYPFNIIDYFALGIFPEEAILMADSRHKFADLVMPQKRILEVDLGKSANYPILLNKVRKTLKTNSIIAYVSSAQSNPGEIGKMRKGLFAISKELNVTITPIAFQRLELGALGNLTNGSFRIGIGKVHIVKDITQSMSYVGKFFQQSLAKKS